jgi:transposase
MGISSRYFPEVWERAVRMVFEHEAGHDSQSAPIWSISEKLAYTAETPRYWWGGISRPGDRASYGCTACRTWRLGWASCTWSP